MRRRRLYVLLALCAALALLAGSALADEEDPGLLADGELSGACGENLTWTLDGSGLLTISGTGEMDDYGMYGDTRPWNQQKTRIKSVSIESGVTSIGQSAFRGCSNLTRITIPDSVARIGGSAFWACNHLAGVIIPDSVTRIDNSAFQGCTSLTSVSIPDHVTCIDYLAFSNCTSLTSVTLPNSITEIRNSAFSNCTSLASLSIPDSVTSIGLSAFEKCTALANIIIPGSVTDVAWDAFSGCTRLTSAGPIGSGCSIEFGWTDKIPDNAFQKSSLTRIVIPDGITHIGRSAFSKCTALTSVKIPASVTRIEGWETFNGCAALTSAGPTGSGCSIEFGWTDKIPDNAFSGCTVLASVTIPDSITSIGEYAFSGCASLTGITIPNNVTDIGVSAFAECTGLTDITIPGSVTRIRTYAFRECTGLTSVTIPNSVTSIGEYVFKSCTGLTSAGPVGGAYSIQMGWTKEIPHSAFKGSCLTSVTIPDGITGIRQSAFEGCGSLTRVTIPGSVTQIGEYAFRDCPGLTSAGPAGMGYNIELSGTGTIPSYAFRKSCLTRVVIPEGITGIGDHAFQECVHLTSVTIPGGVTSIGEHTFDGCTGLTGVSIPDGVTSIGQYAFYGCTNLTSINIPGSVTRIGNAALLRCPGLVSAGPVGMGYNIELGWTEEIPDSAFYGLGLTRVVIPDGVTKIGYSAFVNCTSLTSVRIPGSVTEISPNAFSGCTGLTRVKIPDCVTSIGSAAFYGCTNLTSINIPASVTSIDESVFGGCTGLARVTIPASVTSIAASAFDKCTALADVYYTGNEDQWNAIQKGGGNTPLQSAAIHYNSTAPEGPGGPDLPDIPKLPENAMQELVFFGSGSWSRDAQTYAIASGGLGGGIVITRDTVLPGTEFVEDLLNRFILVDYIIEDPPEGTIVLSPPHMALCVRPVETRTAAASSADGKLRLIAQHVLDGKVLREDDLYAGTGILNSRTSIDGTTYNVLADAASSMPDTGSAVGFSLIKGHGNGVIVELHSRSYVTKLGTLDSYDASARTARIDGQDYPVNLFECGINLKPFGGKQVFFLLANGEIVHLDALENAAYRLNVSLRPTSSVSHGSGLDRTVEYKDGRFQTESFRYTVTLSNQAAYTYPELYRQFYDRDLIDASCGKTPIALDSAVWTCGAGLQISWDGPGGITLQPGESVQRECTVSFASGYRPAERSETLKANLTASGRRSGQGEALLRASRGVTFTVQNRDCRKAPSSAQNPGGTPARASAARAAGQELDKLPLNFLSLNLDTMSRLFGIEGTALQRLEKELLTAVVLSDIPEKTFQDKVEDKVLTKVFQKYKPDVSALDYTVRLTYGIQTPSYGLLTVRFDCKVSSYGLSGSTYSKFIAVGYEILDPPSGISQPSGALGLGVSVDTKRFQDAAYALVEEELKSAFDGAWGNSAEQVAEFLFSQTVQDILNAANTSVKDIAWSLLIWPSKSFTASCPVDVCIYDGAGNLLGSVENNVVTRSSEEFQLWVDGDVKHAAGLALDCRVQYTATDSGYMNVDVTENYGAGLSLRRISHYDVPLKNGLSYGQSISSRLQQPQAEYGLTASDTGARLQADEAASLFTLNVDPSLGQLEITDWKVTDGDTTVVYLRGDQALLSPGCTAHAARYDEDGRLAELITGETGGLCVTFRRPLSDAWSLFLWDSSCRPVMAKSPLSPDLRGV